MGAGLRRGDQATRLPSPPRHGGPARLWRSALGCAPPRPPKRQAGGAAVNSSISRASACDACERRLEADQSLDQSVIGRVGAVTPPLAEQRIELVLGSPEGLPHGDAERAQAGTANRDQQRSFERRPCKRRAIPLPRPGLDIDKTNAFP